MPFMLKVKHFKTIFTTEDAPVQKIKHFRTTISTEDTHVKM